jgi:hypothetical protein
MEAELSKVAVSCLLSMNSLFSFIQFGWITHKRIQKGCSDGRVDGCLDQCAEHPERNQTNININS